MPGSAKAVLACSCNNTVALDGAMLSQALKLDQSLVPQRELCRRECSRFGAALAASDDVLVACTQESALFRELADEAGYAGTLRFANIREMAGWSDEGAAAQPKIAALLALARLPEPAPVPAVGYSSGGALLVVGPMPAALSWAERLREQLDVTVLATSHRAGELAGRREYAVYSGNNIKISGYSGNFKVEWEQDNPIDLELCTRCNACVRACPESAIDWSYQVDAQKCRSHRACVAACATIGAIEFDRKDRHRADAFDLVLDLSAEPLIRLPHPPQGYLAPGRDPLDQAGAALELVRYVGEFEKPSYNRYEPRLCAHARNAITGCTRCIDVCSTGAIRPAGDRIEIDAHLCQGCGGCATVCPSGAIAYAYPAVADLGTRIKTVLSTYRAAGGRDACLLFHATDTETLLMESGRRGRGLPARVIPLALHDVASVGLDTWLGAIALGASQCVILSQPDQVEGYQAATGRQLEIGTAILAGLGYAGTPLSAVCTDDWRELERALWSLVPAGGPAQAASFNLMDDKRRTLDFAIDHLARHAPRPAESLPLPADAPFGTVHVDKAACTLCMSCVGACPASALVDGRDAPRLNFVERNCLQCGLCRSTCPENAITLEPRLALGAEARRERLLNEAQAFECVRCGKPFGTKQMIDAMVGRLAGHAMFGTGPALARLQMCADCRVADMMESRNETTIFEVSK